MKLNELYVAIMSLKQHFGTNLDTFIKDGHLSIFTNRLPSNREIDIMKANGWEYDGGNRFILSREGTNFFA